MEQRLLSGAVDQLSRSGGKKDSPKKQNPGDEKRENCLLVLVNWYLVTANQGLREAGLKSGQQNLTYQGKKVIWESRRWSHHLRSWSAENYNSRGALKVPPATAGTGLCWCKLAMSLSVLTAGLWCGVFDKGVWIVNLPGCKFMRLPFSLLQACASAWSSGSSCTVSGCAVLIAAECELLLQL